MKLAVLLVAVLGWGRVCSGLRPHISAARIADLVAQRNDKRAERDYAHADFFKVQLEEAGVVLVDYPSPGTWRYEEGPGPYEKEEEGKDEDEDEDELSLMKLSELTYHIAQGGDGGGGTDPAADHNNNAMDEIVARAVKVVKRHRRRHKQLKLGRMVVDAAVNFALAGVTDAALFALLTVEAERELRRWGHRASCRSVDILQFCEKWALAGAQAQAVFSLAAKLLPDKHDYREEYDASRARLASGDYALLDARPLLNLFRVASKRQKCKFGLQTPLDSVPTRVQEEGAVSCCFAEPDLPLFLDLGCGYGASLLGLALAQSGKGGTPPPESTPSNFLGVELNPVAAGYTRGLAARWGLSGHCQITQRKVLSCLEDLRESHAETVRWISISFPTPYALEGLATAGNTQLPSLDEFMVSPAVLAAAKALLRPGSGCLYFQTNCADVAIHMRDMCEREGFRVAASPDEAARAWNGASGGTTVAMQWAEAEAGEEGQATTTTTKETKETNEEERSRREERAGVVRPRGVGWLAASPLPMSGRTETEVYQQEFYSRPLFRALFFA